MGAASDTLMENLKLTFLDLEINSATHSELRTAIESRARYSPSSKLIGVGDTALGNVTAAELGFFVACVTNQTEVHKAQQENVIDSCFSSLKSWRASLSV